MRYAWAVPRLAVNRSSPRRSGSPGTLGEVPCQPPRDGPSSGFRAAAGMAETRPSPLPLGLPGALRAKSATFAVHSTQLRPPDLLPSACLGRLMSGSFLLPEGSFLLPGRLGLLIFDFLFLLLMLTIGIGDQYAFRSRARFCPSASPAVSVFGQGRVRPMAARRKIGGQAGGVKGMRRQGTLLMCLLAWRKRNLNVNRELERVLAPK